MKYQQSWLAVANSALSRINQDLLQSFDEGNRTASEINQMLPYIIGSVLQMNDWKCARKRILLAPLADAPAFGYTAQFQLPNDFIRLVSVNTDKWEREGSVMLADADHLELIYIAQPDDAAKLDPILLDAIATLLAGRLAAKFLGDTSLASYFENLASGLIQEARLREQAGMKDIPMTDEGDGDYYGWTV